MAKQDLGVLIRQARVICKCHLWGSGAVRGQTYAQSSFLHNINGIVFDDAVQAFVEIAGPFLDDHYYPFFGLEVGARGAKRVARAKIRDTWQRFGVKWDDKVFAWEELYLDDELRGAGRGRAAVARIEEFMRSQGVRAIVLQAGTLPPYYEQSEPFWTKFGYQVWPGDYDGFSDRIMVKVL